MKTKPDAEHYYDKFPRERVESWLAFFTTPKNGLYPHPRGYDCGDCKASSTCRMDCMSSVTPQGVGLINWQNKPCTSLIADLRIGLGLSTEPSQDDHSCVPI
jgi:hypothetical protein